MPIQGLRNDENFLAAQRPQNWRETILRLYPNSAEAAKAPLTALTAAMKSEKTDDPVFHWFQKKLDARRLKLLGAHTNVVATLTIDPAYISGSTPATAFGVKAGDVLRIEQTGEYVRVSADPSANNLIPVTRAFMGSAGTAIDAAVAGTNPFAIVIGSAFEEGSLAPTSMSMDPVELSNYTQIFRSTLGITRTAQKTRLRTGDAVVEAKRECLEYFSVDMERGFWFNGAKTIGTLNGQPIRTTAGVLSQITAAGVTPWAATTANGLATVGIIDMNWVEKGLKDVFSFGSSQKMGFASNRVLMAIGQVVRKNSTYNIEYNEKEYGMRVARLVSPFGELVIKSHPLFNQMTGGLNGATAYTAVENNMYILDMANVRYRYIDDVKYESDLTPVGLDGMKSGYLAECGLEVNHGETHAIWTGIISGVKDAA